MNTPSLSESKGNDAALVTPGQILAGKFRVERVIGEGGMGIVVEATHIALDQRVAIKFLRHDARLLPDVVARFDREARSAVKLKSEHVARVIDVGKTDDGTPFMVMEYLEGQDLSQRVLEGGALPISEAVEYVIQACEGVGEAHAKGIVHRDLKPENLFLVERGGWKQVKVLDFGISKAALTGNASSVDMSVNATSVIMGSPYYMSPEQLRSTKSVDHRADVWSLGVVLFELLTGTTPFDETLEFTELVAEILEAPHRRLREFRPDAPEALELVVDKALAKDRANRFQNTAELAISLLPFAPSRARVSAERTTSISRAAGLLSDPSIALPPSVAPPAPDGRTSHVTPMPVMRQAGLPNLGAPDAPQSHPSLLTNAPVETVAHHAEPSRRKKPPVVAIFFGALILLGLGGALAAGVIRGLTPGAAASGTASVSVATPEHTVVATPATTTAPIVDTAAPTASVATKPSAKPTATQLKWTPPITKPTSSATATATTKPTGPSLDISHER